MTDPDDYTCVRCGACCVSTIETGEYVFLRQDDVARLTQEEQKVFVHRTTLPIIGDQFSMKTRSVRGDCRCVALEGNIGEQVSCSVYDRRPNACRQFPAGSTICNYARQSVMGISLK